MSCEVENLNKMPRDSFKTHYLFHSNRAQTEGGITGNESGLELDRFYRERFGIPIIEDLIKDFAEFIERGGKRGFFR